jgi:phage terminase small subunit
VKHRQKLTAKQSAFVAEYLKDLNATQAAIRAGYSKNNADKIGSQLLGKSRVSTAIQLVTEARSRRTEIAADNVVREIARLAFFDPRRLFDVKGKFLPIAKWPDEVAAAISSIEIVKAKGKGKKPDLITKVRFWDKSKNLELLGRHLRIFLDTPPMNPVNLTINQFRIIVQQLLHDPRI